MKSLIRAISQYLNPHPSQIKIEPCDGVMGWRIVVTPRRRRIDLRTVEFP